MISLKRIIATVVATATFVIAVSTQAMAQTTDVSPDDFVDINGYQCRLVGDNYVTEIDGEEYIVIDLSKGGSERAEQQTSSARSSSVVDVRNGVEVKESVNLSLGDYESPEFIVAPNNTELSAYIWTGFWIPQSYYIVIYTYTDELGWGEDYSGILKFGNGYKYLLTGTASRLVKRIQIEFIADKSPSLIKQFNYWVGTNVQS